MRMRGFLLALCAAACLPASGAPASGAVPVTQLEAMTWTEVRDRVAAGSTTVLVPIGGTEQSGPHMVLGKHNVRARVLADRIAQRLGNALVAPVVAYVPEGSIDPPAAHMRWPGTISVPEAGFEAMLAATARSLCRHGFRDVVFLGDHGGYQKNLERAAAQVRPGRAGGSACRVHALLEYYRATQNEYVAQLKARGFSTEEIGTHAGLADTSLSMAIDPALVREGAWSGGARPAHGDGIDGDPRRASAELGRLGVDRIVEASVAALRARQQRAGEDTVHKTSH